MRTPILALAIALSMLGCEEKTTMGSGRQARAPLVDLTATSGLGAVRSAFNARKGEARFLTLLSPT